MDKGTGYFCNICAREILRGDKLYAIQFIQPGEPREEPLCYNVEETLCYNVCETCYNKMFDHMVKISYIGKEEKKEEDISCNTCRHLVNSDTEVYCKMNHPIIGGLGNSCCSEWKSKTHSHENPTT